MKIIKSQGFYFRMIQVVFHGSPNFRQIIFVQNFITFKVKGPITCTVILRDHLLLGIDKTAILHFFIPIGRDDDDFF